MAVVDGGNPIGVTDVHVHSYRQSLLDWLAVNIIAVVSLSLSRLDSTRQCLLFTGRLYRYRRYRSRLFFSSPLVAAAASAAE